MRTQTSIWQIVVAILFLGNVQFQNDASDQAQVQNPDALQQFSYIFQCDEAAALAARIAERQRNN